MYLCAARTVLLPLSGSLVFGRLQTPLSSVDSLWPSWMRASTLIFGITSVFSNGVGLSFSIFIPSSALFETVLSDW